MVESLLYRKLYTHDKKSWNIPIWYNWSVQYEWLKKKYCLYGHGNNKFVDIIMLLNI